MSIDSITELPRCYGHEDPRSNTCLTCEFQIPCRETLKMGAGSPVLIIEDDKRDEEEIRSELDADSDEEEETDEEESVQ